MLPQKNLGELGINVQRKTHERTQVFLRVNIEYRIAIMSDRPLKLRSLRKILSRYECWEDESRGKGSHTTFFRRIEGNVFSYPIPHRNEVLACYVKAIRRKFKLCAEDGIMDDDFYSSL